MSDYNFSAIEKKWQKYWLENKTFRTTDGTDGRSGAPAPQPKEYKILKGKPLWPRKQ